MTARRDPVCGMMVDEVAAFKLSWKGGDYYFCSEHCRDKFMAGKKPAWRENRLLQFFLLYLLILILGDVVSFLKPLKNSLFMYLRLVAFPLLLGLFLGGVIDWLVPREYISYLLAARKKRTIVYSVITGFIMSACSHGILALAIQLYRKGASTPAVISFLLASPWANLPLTILMLGLFGAKGLLIILAAVVIALITGYIFMFLEKRSLIEHNPNTILLKEDFSIINDALARIKEVKVSPVSTVAAVKSIWAGSVALANMVLWWIMLGMFLASLAAAFLPPHFMHQYMGPTLLGLLVTLFIATIIEVCSEGTAPLAFEIFRQTGALGNSFVFLMAGVVTDYTEIGLLWSNIGWRTALWLPAVTVPQVILLGVLANVIFK